jgi:hypothetical protein
MKDSEVMEDMEDMEDTEVEAVGEDHAMEAVKNLDMEDMGMVEDFLERC